VKIQLAVKIVSVFHPISFIIGTYLTVRFVPCDCTAALFPVKSFHVMLLTIKTNFSSSTNPLQKCCNFWLKRTFKFSMS